MVSLKCRLSPKAKSERDKEVSCSIVLCLYGNMSAMKDCRADDAPFEIIEGE